jgi:hypothetical protein
MIALEKLIRTLTENGATFMKLEDAAAEFERRAPLAAGSSQSSL